MMARPSPAPRPSKVPPSCLGRRDLGKESVRGFARQFDDGGPFPLAQEFVGHAGRNEGPLGVAQIGLQARRRDPHAKKVGRDVFELVRLIEHDGVVVGEGGARVGASQREIGEEKVVVHDHDARGLGLALHAGDEALAK